MVTVSPAVRCDCAVELAEAHAKIENLEIGLASSRRIGMAMGILMSVYKVPEEQAFEMLVAVSQHVHRKLRDLADDVVATGTLDWVLSQTRNGTCRGDGPGSCSA